MERKNNLVGRLVALESRIYTQKNMLRLFVVLSILLAITAGLGWEQYTQLSKKYDVLVRRHERLNKIYLQQQGK